ncbi:MAG: STAS domain-containing protein [Bacteroidaceae bacterium]|nr:STAS domain-containing protein [Bacteroidaceae bacterium]
MDINITKGEKITVEISGRLDTAATPEFSEAIADIISEKNNVVFDCSDLEYIASSGLRAFLSAHKSLTALGGTLEVTGVQPAVQSIFDMTGFSVMLKIGK